MPADTSVKYFHSEMPGAPTLSGTAGALLAVLDACLVNGFGAGTLDSMSVASNIVTATRAAGHPFEVDSVVEIAGATPAGLNGKHKVTAYTTTTYTFEVSGVADGAATGTITHKLAALGWSNSAVAAGTNIKAYQSTHLEASGCLLRVADNGTDFARCVGYETMSDINTGTGPFPTSAQLSGGYYWVKSETENATTRPWFIIGDERAFYMWTQHGEASAFSDTYLTYFGDFDSKVPGDAYGCALGAQSSDRSSSNATVDCMSYASGVPGSLNSTLVAARSSTGLGSAILCGRVHSVMQVNNGGINGYSGNVGMTYPNPADNALYVVPYYINHSTILRGVFPGVYYVPHSIGSAQFAQRERLSSIAGLSGKTLLAISLANGPIMFDATGPWR